MTPIKHRRIRIRRQVITHRRAKCDYRRIARRAIRKAWNQWKQAKYAQLRDLKRHPFYRRGLSAWVKRILGLDRLNPTPRGK